MKASSQYKIICKFLPFIKFSLSTMATSIADYTFPSSVLLSMALS